MNLTTYSILAGACFGTWPLLLNRTGLSGNLATFILSLIILGLVTPFALATSCDFGKVNWLVMIFASVISGSGLLLFNTMLTKAPTESVGSFIIIATIIQISVPIIYDINKQGLDAKRSIGFAFAAIAITLLKS